MFVSVATKELQKEVRQLQEKKIEPDFDWKYELNVQVGQIVRILRETLKNVDKVSPELTAKLDMYSDKLASTPKPPPPPPSSSLEASASTKRKEVLPKPTRPESSWNSSDPKEMPMVQVVGNLFGKSQADLVEDIINLRSLCTEKVSSASRKIGWAKGWRRKGASRELPSFRSCLRESSTLTVFLFLSRLRWWI